MYWSIFKFRALFYMCPDSSVGSMLYIFPLILVDQRGREFKSTLRNNFFWPFFSVSNYIISYIYVICMLYSTQIRSQKVWVVYVYYRFILEQCALEVHTCLNHQVDFEDKPLQNDGELRQRKFWSYTFDLWLTHCEKNFGKNACKQN